MLAHPRLVTIMTDKNAQAEMCHYFEVASVHAHPRLYACPCSPVCAPVCAPVSLYGHYMMISVCAVHHLLVKQENYNHKFVNLTQFLIRFLLENTFIILRNGVCHVICGRIPHTLIDDVAVIIRTQLGVILFQECARFC